MIKIPIFKLEFEKKFIERYKKLSEEILLSEKPLSEYTYVKEFEDKFARLVGSRYAVAVTNGTAALELAFRIINVRNKTVLMPSNTFIATAIAAINAGAKVGLVDIEEENFSLEPELLETAIKDRKKHGEEIGAVTVVHIGGIISRHIKKIRAICNKYDIVLIEDAAQAHCSEMNGLRAGTIGKIGCFSFFPTKVMTTAEGGMLTTNDKEIYEMACSLKNFGRDPNDIDIMINSFGSNFKISEFTGLLGSLECDRVQGRIKKRQELAKIYVSRLCGSTYKTIMQKDGICSQYKMIVKTHIDREWLRKYCKDQGITLTGEVYKIPIHKQPAYKDQFKNFKLPITEMVCDSHICPPLYPELTKKEINYICDVLLKAEQVYEK